MVHQMLCDIIAYRYPGLPNAVERSRGQANILCFRYVIPGLETRRVKKLTFADFCVNRSVNGFY